jgi:hypothetical protein
MLFFILSLLFILVGCRKEEKPSPPSLSNEKANSAPAENKSLEYSLTNEERNVLEALLHDDFLGYAEGGDAIVGESNEWNKPIQVSADSLQINYEANEVLGDQKYRHKLLAVPGIVTSIDRGIGENYFVKLRGGRNMFTSPHAQMADGFTEYLASLKKGQKVYLVCKGDGMLLGSASLSSCKPADNWAKEKTATFIDSLNIMLKNGDQAAKMITLLSIAIASKPKEFKNCFSGVQKKQDECVSKGLKTLDSTAFASAGQKIKLDWSEIKKMFKE